MRIWERKSPADTMVREEGGGGAVPEGPMLEQFKKSCSSWEGLMLDSGGLSPVKGTQCWSRRRV